MATIRVLLVDDAAVVRRLVTAALNRDPDLEVVGTAADGQIALARLAELQPDVILLDLEMPVMSGLETLVALRKTHPRLPVIMFSRFTQKGVEATVHALTLGADDYVPKPGDGLDVTRCIEELLIPKIKLLGRRHRGGRNSAATACGHRFSTPPAFTIRVRGKPSPACRDRGDWHFDGRSQRPGRTAPALPSRLAGASGHRAAHAARFHRPSRRAPEREISGCVYEKPWRASWYPRPRPG